MHLTYIESTLDSGKTPVTLLPSDIVSPTVSPPVPPIVKLTSSVSNVSTNNPLRPALNSNTPSSQGYGRELANLAKMYTDKAKYNGENDSFAFKLTIFRDICARADVLQEILLKAFSTMLTSLALDYYYSNTSISIVATFDKVCESIGIYFEGAEYKRSVLSKWNMTALKSIIEKNEGKSMEECLQLLIKNLCHLQHRLDAKLRTDKFIYNKLINTCQDIPACQYACFKPADSLAGLINDLRSSIITFQKANPDNIQT